MEITPLEANFLIYCLDAYCGVSDKGTVLKVDIPGYSIAGIQELRDRLMLIHEHPEEPHHPDCPATDGMGCRCDGKNMIE